MLQSQSRFFHLQQVARGAGPFPASVQAEPAADSTGCWAISSISVGRTCSRQHRVPGHFQHQCGRNLQQTAQGARPFPASVWAEPAADSTGCWAISSISAGRTVRGRCVSRTLNPDAPSSHFPRPPTSCDPTWHRRVLPPRYASLCSILVESLGGQQQEKLTEVKGNVD